MFEVLRTRCSASLQLPLSVMNVVNGTLWLVYGLAISDYFIAVPNGVGAVLGIIYCALIFIFPRKSAKWVHAGEGPDGLLHRPACSLSLRMLRTSSCSW